MADWQAGTRVVRAGLPAAQDGEPLLPGPTFAAPYHLSGDPAAADYVYGRYGNPTWARYEAALGELEGGEAVLFASGMAAASAVLLSALVPGDAVVVPSDCYPAVRALATGHLAERGVEARLYASGDESALRVALPGARLAWIECPSNPGLEVVDVAALAAAARTEGVALAVDNTLATPLAHRPLELGAEFSVSSASKHLTGHSDLVLGYVAVRDAGRATRLREWRTATGAAPGPFEAWLAHRSLATLELRLDRACANAQALAELLAGRGEVGTVRYPGLPGDPSHAVASRCLERFGTVVGFTLLDAGAAERFLRESELIAEATSFGGVHTTAERRARWGIDAVPEGFIRLSAGCEATEDLVADVVGALDGL